MQLQQRLNAFRALGEFLSQFSISGMSKNNVTEANGVYFDGFKHQIKLAYEHNSWFTQSNVLFATNSWANALKVEHLQHWVKAYNFNSTSSKTIAVIMAGNIPLVGFHDVLCALITGHNILIKQSSNDKHLLPYLLKYLEVIEPEFKGRISFTEDQLTNFDTVIATGSNNTARYFEYYFKDKPSIIRKNRNSVAVLTGNENETQLKSLANDIFQYYGLGCRSISKLFVPKGYNFDSFFNAIYEWNTIINDTKYANNYDYNKAVYLMSEFDILDNGFFMIKEDQSYASPIATLFYEYYDSKSALKEQLTHDSEQIQCIVADGIIDSEIPFGQTQHPQLWDYADNVDTVEFLLKI